MIKEIYKAILLFVLCLIFAFQVMAQTHAENSQVVDNPHKITKNNIYAVSGWTVSVIATSIVYERHIMALKNSALNARIGFGAYGFLWGSSGTQYFSTMGFVSGAEKDHHFEGCLGVAALVDTYAYRSRNNSNSSYYDGYIDWYPAAYIGYRYKKPNGKFLFRTGFGWPDNIGFSLGASF